MEAFKFSFSILLSIFAIIGGVILFIQTPSLGVKGLMLLGGILIIVFLIKYISLIFTSTKTPTLLRIDFSNFLQTRILSNKFKNEFEELKNLTNCSLTLLLLDQTESGAWANTYLYRRLASKEGIPLAKGSLTGTPLALISIFSLIESDDYNFIEYFTKNLTEILNKVIQPDGQYLRRYTIGQVGRVPEQEPPRHTAGGLLSKILIGNITNLDKTCLKFLLGAKTLPEAWDKAILIRTLTSIIYNSNFSIVERIKSYRQRNKLLNNLLNEAKLSIHQSLVWSHPYSYGQDVSNQWATVWALYPLLSEKIISPRKKDKLQKILENLIISHISASQSDTSLLPVEINKDNFHGKGEYVFSTVLIPLLYNIFENFSKKNVIDSKENKVINALLRVTRNYEKIIFNPSKPSSENILSLEGYFAWAGLCITSASLGIKIDKTTTKLIIKLKSELEELLYSSYSLKELEEHTVALIKKYNIFAEHHINPLKNAIVNLLEYKKAIKNEMIKSN